MSLLIREAPADPVLAARAWLRRAAELGDDGLTTWTARIGTQSIRFRCSSSQLARGYRHRLAGVPAPPGNPDLQLDLLETAALGWPDHDVNLGGPAGDLELTRRFTAAGLTAIMPARGGRRDGGPAVVFDPSVGRGLILVRRASSLPPWASGAPFALALHLALASRAQRLVHGAALGRDGVGALLAGPGGVGKSGTTLAGITHGMQTTGDDYLLLGVDERVATWPVYRILKQDRRGVERAGLPGLAGRPVNWNGKVELDLPEDFPGSLADEFELRSLLVTEIVHQPRTTILPISPTAAFSAIAESMLVQLPGARLSGFSLLTRLTRQLPAFRLRLSSDPAEIAEAINRHLA